MRDLVKKAAYMRAYRLAHLAEMRARDADYRAAHRAEAAANTRAWHARQRPVVYVWMAPDGQADYVGRGTLHRARQTRLVPGKHQRDWWTPQHILLAMTCESEWQAMEMEGKWGAFYQPRHNREGYRHAGRAA